MPDHPRYAVLRAEMADLCAWWGRQVESRTAGERAEELEAVLRDPVKVAATGDDDAEEITPMSDAAFSFLAGLT